MTDKTMSAIDGLVPKWTSLADFIMAQRLVLDDVSLSPDDSHLAIIACRFAADSAAALASKEAEIARLRILCDEAADIIKRQQEWQTYGEKLERGADVVFFAEEVQSQRKKNNALKARATAAEAEIARLTPPIMGNVKLSHTRSCPSLTPGDGPCTCALVERRYLQTEQTMNAAWRERATAAEAQVERLREVAKRDREYCASQSGENVKLANRVIAAEAECASQREVIATLNERSATYEAECERLREAVAMAKTRLDDFADKANAGQVHYSARELKRKIGAAFADFGDTPAPASLSRMREALEKICGMFTMYERMGVAGMNGDKCVGDIYNIARAALSDTSNAESGK